MTRADFFVGKGKDAEYLGSVAGDGYRWDKEDGDHYDSRLDDCKTEAEFRDVVNDIIQHDADKYGNGTFAADGWPWPWDDPRITNYAYAWTSKGFEVNPEDADWPRMDTATMTFGSRSGLIVFGS